MKKLWLLYSLAFCLLHQYIKAQADTARYASVGDTVSCGNFKYAWSDVVPIDKHSEGAFRDCRPVKKHFFYNVTKYLDVNNKVWLQKERGEKKIQYYSFPFDYYLDRERQADSTFSGLLVVDMQAFGGYKCHLLTYDATGNQTSDVVISIKEYNRLAKKRNKARALLSKGEENSRCLSGFSLNIPLLSSGDSGK